MCDTMGNVPVEDVSPYVLTEDMIDAAMTEQFAFQDGIESEEELSSQDENMEVDQDTQTSPDTDSNENTACFNTQNGISAESVIVNHENDFNSVLVIETGLDKKHRESASRNSDSFEKEKTTNNLSVQTDEGSDQLGLGPVSSNFSNNKANATSHNGVVSKIKLHQPGSESTNYEEGNEEGNEDEKKLPLLKKILSSSPDNGVNNLESIDLCDSDTDTENFSEDELTEVELIDDELKSVMESNLMAEIGMTVNNRKSLSSAYNKTPETSPPKIAIKHIGRISETTFNSIEKNMSNKTGLSCNTNSTTQNNVASEMNKAVQKAGNTNTSDILKEPVPTAIQLNKIAVPHKTFVTSQGQQMKCVYVANSSALPVVINSNPTSVGSKNIKYMLTTSQLKRGPLQITPITALTNMTKQTVPLQKPLLPKHDKQVSLAPQLKKLPLGQKNTIPKPIQIKKDENNDSLIKTIIFHNLKKPYVPLEVNPFTKSYACVDCSDRFMLESSLSHHLNRRSIIIRYWCRICQTELQFFNRCVLFRHLRSHTNSIKHIDTSCIKLASLPKEMIDDGIVSTFFKVYDTTGKLPDKDCILQHTTKNGPQNEVPNKSPSKVVSLNDNTISIAVNTSNSFIKTITAVPSQKIITVAGQSKSVCFPSQTSVIIDKPPTATLSRMPITLPKQQKMTIVQTLRKQSQEPTSLVQKPLQKSAIVVGNKSATTQVAVKHTAPINTLPPNVLCESAEKHANIEVIDDDTNIIANNSIEDEEIDVENVVEDDLCTDTSIEIKKEKFLSNTSPENVKVKLAPKNTKQLKRLNCIDCGARCLNISKHLNGLNRPTNQKLECEVCQLVLPTKCALKIHLRIHMKMAPYKCPDCGKDFSVWDDLHAHLKFSCGHLAKCVRYLCVSCKAHFPSKGVLRHHIYSKHSRSIYKCNTCPVAYFNTQSLNKHISIDHHSEKVLMLDYKQCSMCPKKLVPTHKFSAHVLEHLNNNNVLIYGYKCPLCSIVFANKMAFIIHQIKEKEEIEKKEGKKTSKKGDTQPGASFSSHKNSSVSSDYLQSGLKSPDFNSDIEEEQEIVRKYPDLNEEDCSSAEKDPLSLEGWESSQEQRVNEKREELCIVCKQNLVIILPGIDLNKQSLCCKHCVKPLDLVDPSLTSKTQVGSTMYKFNTHVNVKKTVKRKRNLLQSSARFPSFEKISTDHRPQSSGISEKDTSIDSEGYSDSLDSMPAKKKSRKKQSRDKIDPAGQSHIQGQVITSKSPDELVCSKCAFVAETKEVFLEHITIHRTDPNTFQCLECGLCFVVLPSLERHLQMHHGIKDVVGYTEKNRSSMPQKVVLVEEETEDNQCRVCYEMFDSGSSLEKHFRTHGMAFMNSLSKSP